MAGNLPVLTGICLVWISGSDPFLVKSKGDVQLTHFFFSRSALPTHRPPVKVTTTTHVHSCRKYKRGGKIIFDINTPPPPLPRPIHPITALTIWNENRSLNLTARGDATPSPKTAPEISSAFGEPTPQLPKPTQRKFRRGAKINSPLAHSSLFSLSSSHHTTNLHPAAGKGVFAPNHAVPSHPTP